MTGSVTTRELLQPIDFATLHRLHPARYPFFLESAASGTEQGRYDILFAFPGRTLVLDSQGHLDGRKAGDFLRAFDRDWQATRIDTVPVDLPFTGGWFLYLGYELAGQIEPVLALPPFDGFPVAFAVRIPAAVVRDVSTGAVCVVAEAGCEPLVAQIVADIDAAGALPLDEPSAEPLLVGPLTEEPPERYVAAVAAAQRYIYDGDVFQANLSREWIGSLSAAACDMALYRRLKASNPGPFAGFAAFGDAAIVSSSPERLVRVRGGIAETRPIAGTMPRDGDDEAVRRRLLGHPKERAEHIMLIDLERNDLGRVCRPGTVEVDEVMALETYSHVHHIVSNVRGLLRDGITPGDVLRAVFPGGTITGCPKVRCMAIIAELERTGRGPYTGSMGYVNRDGSLDVNILIRSFVRRGRSLSLRAGAGIVADSDPEREVAETRAKARGLLLALAD